MATGLAVAGLVVSAASAYSSYQSGEQQKKDAQKQQAANNHAVDVNTDNISIEGQNNLNKQTKDFNQLQGKFMANKAASGISGQTRDQLSQFNISEQQRQQDLLKQSTQSRINAAKAGRQYVATPNTWGTTFANISSGISQAYNYNKAGLL